MIDRNVVVFPAPFLPISVTAFHEFH